MSADKKVIYSTPEVQVFSTTSAEIISNSGIGEGDNETDIVTVNVN